MNTTPMVIVGGGAGAAAAAATLREYGCEAPIVVVSSETVAPYERPPLSKGLLTGSVVPADLAVYLRDLAQGVALAERLATGEPLLVLGGGFIGCEVAASARALGVEATVLEMDEFPMQRALGRAAGEAMAAVHRDRGVDLRTAETVLAVRSGATGVQVRTDRGEIDGGTLLVAVGLEPATGLAARAGIEVDPVTGGIAVDAFCRTSDPDVFAAGDIAAHDHPRYQARLRVEHHDNAVKQGRAAARSMLDPTPEPYDEIHWFWSDQYEHSLQAVGHIGDHDRQIVRSSVEDLSFSVVSLRERRVRSVFALNRATEVLGGRRLITADVEVDPDQIADTSTSLKRLATAAAGARP
jgi:3-phenylpropionate/trans-cinnamate dioxygenase ferredoxin reductase subunit